MRSHEKILLVAPFLLFTVLAFPSKAEWVTLTPLREAKDKSTLGDIESHTLPSYNIGGMKVVYRNPSDLCNSAHEQIHGLNGQLRTKYKVQNAYYLLNNKVFLIKDHPKITIKQIAQKVPIEKRGKIYPLYMVKQAKYWDKQPLYIFDECVAYLTGAMVGVETKNKHRATESFSHCLEMYYYGTVCVNLAKNTDFKHQNDLNEFVGVLYSRILLLQEQMEMLGWLNEDHKKALELIR